MQIVWEPAFTHFSLSLLAFFSFSFPIALNTFESRLNSLVVDLASYTELIYVDDSSFCINFLVFELTGQATLFFFSSATLPMAFSFFRA